MTFFVALTLVGCSEPPPARVAGGPVTTTESSTVSQAAAPITVRNSGAGRSAVAVRRGVLAWGCNGAPFAKDSPDTAQILVPTTATRAEIRVPTVPNEVSGDTKCATMGSGAESIVVIADVVHRKSSGLESESYELTLFSFDLTSPSPLAKTVVTSDSTPMSLTGIFGSADGIAVSYAMANNGYEPQVHYYSGRTLTPTWKGQGTVIGATDSLFAVEHPILAATSRYSVLAAADGRPLDAGLYDRVGTIVRALSFVYSSDVGFAFAWHGISADDHSLVIDGIVWIDGGDIGKQQDKLDEATDIQPDPISDLVLVTYGDSKPAAYKVFDRTTWELKFEIDSAKSSGVNISALGISGEKLYILNGHDAPVIDIATGRSVHSGWSAFPLADLGGVTVVAMESDHGLNAGCIDPDFGRGDRKVIHYNCGEFTLVPDVDGRFPGPNY
ncbi:hypothetical protein [Nocardia lasii]|uniref:Uncharacterized protein n=1 Tax=Nocardia lasii TaxID=1616107 RepID=A0ABW1JS58_9NOCA